ncbi:hypothetical protein D3C80_1159300 [compost metagenome]
MYSVHIVNFHTLWFCQVYIDILQYLIIITVIHIAFLDHLLNSFYQISICFKRINSCWVNYEVLSSVIVSTNCFYKVSTVLVEICPQFLSGTCWCFDVFTDNFVHWDIVLIFCLNSS